jgi:hypothetical protein
MPLHDKQLACYVFLTVHGPEACLVSGAQEFWPRQSKDLEGLREHPVKTGAVRPGPPICHKESRCFIAFKTRLLEYTTVVKKLEPQLG